MGGWLLTASLLAFFGLLGYIPLPLEARGGSGYCLTLSVSLSAPVVVAVVGRNKNSCPT